ncbi:Beta-amylase 7 [Acorus calamus]|uniref:Beta-amylase n=1 Tax=Acorus calamus TaxID=4465 RepID=A0AAV9C4K1_ACOCL|nr:Beta-amylase 7 [Acorus calamus]
MSREMERLVGTSEEDEEEEEMGVKEEEGDDDEGVAMDGGGEDVMNRYHQRSENDQNPQEQQIGRRARPKEEKERTKLRERHRRAITARILSGLRRHGNYNLRVRADINDVIGALAREAGWVVLPDGTTFPSSRQTGRPPGGSPSPMLPSTSSPVATLPLKGISSPGVGGMCRMKGVYVPPTPSPVSHDASSRPRASASAALMGDGEGGAITGEDPPLIGNCMDVVTDNQVIETVPRMQERDFAGTPYVPVYVMLPLGVINMKCELVDPDGLMKQLRMLESINVDGVMVDCWWGIVEAHAPQEYNWNGYKRLFQIVRELKLKLQVVMSFHECGGNVGDDVCIPLPHWIAEIGRSNPDIFFTDKEGRRNPECLTWGIDKERVLRGRTAVEVYFDYMRSFRVEFNDFFEDGIISEIEVGLGPCGELRYPSYPVKHGWRYPGIGEFQSLVDHADRVFSLAKIAFEGTCLAAKVSGIHWWYKTASHAAELTAGFYNPCNRDGYASIAAILKKHSVALNFTCVELRTLDQHEDFPEALADPEGLVWQVLNAAWDAGISVASENALTCHDRNGYNKILENAKPMNDPDGRHLSAFTYLRLSPELMETMNFLEFQRFVKQMHGEAVLDL